MEMVKRGLKTLTAASVEIGVSYRQAEQIYQRYREGGDGALGACGALPKNRINLQTPIEPPVRGAPLIGIFACRCAKGTLSKNSPKSHRTRSVRGSWLLIS
ncbi:MAG: hypothetical protein LBQ88_06640 [Treponema sp.]|jgi:hypothetical protein|nr:hypothetical protein [Treponema sp.]